MCVSAYAFCVHKQYTPTAHVYGCIVELLESNRIARVPPNVKSNCYYWCVSFTLPRIKLYMEHWNMEYGEKEIATDISSISFDDIVCRSVVIRIVKSLLPIEYIMIVIIIPV